MDRLSPLDQDENTSSLTQSTLKVNIVCRYFLLNFMDDQELNHPVVDDQQIYVSKVLKYGIIRGYYGIIENLPCVAQQNRTSVY
jgi:hypothetical protein